MSLTLFDQFKALHNIALQASKATEPAMGLEPAFDIVIDPEALKAQVESFKQHVGPSHTPF